jgi:hypothetical protein
VRYQQHGGKEFRPAPATHPFGEDVAPGESRRVEVEVTAPGSPGTYRWEWQVVHGDAPWIYDPDDGHRVSTVRVVAPPAAGSPLEAEGRPGADATEPRPWAAAAGPWSPDRSTLWTLSVERFLERPWTGIGIDNFRRTYGKQRGSLAWNEVLTSHNWYLETLVSVGLLGAAPFFAWLVLLSWDLVSRLLGGAASLTQQAVAGGLVSFALHGLLDYFLLFHATALLFWILIGLWVDQRSRSLGERP